MQLFFLEQLRGLNAGRIKLSLLYTHPEGTAGVAQVGSTNSVRQRWAHIWIRKLSQGAGGSDWIRWLEPTAGAGRPASQPACPTVVAAQSASRPAP